MKIRSLGRQTDLIFARHLGSVTDCGDHTLIKTPKNPSYHWGNFIIFDRSPQPGDLKRWVALFDREFPYYSKPTHYTFTWDTENEDPGNPAEFLEAGFEADSAVVLMSNELKPPPRPNSLIEIRPLTSDKDWSQALQNQLACVDPEFANDDYYTEFKTQQMRNYRSLVQAQKGAWFGAFLKAQLVGDLGIFYEGDTARYQSVGTDPHHRRQGICGTLVHQAGCYALDHFGVSQLVMEADPDYHAAKIYESVGFTPVEKNFAVQWWQKPDAKSL